MSYLLSCTWWWDTRLMRAYREQEGRVAKQEDVVEGRVDACHLMYCLCCPWWLVIPGLWTDRHKEQRQHTINTNNTSSPSPPSICPHGPCARSRGSGAGGRRGGPTRAASGGPRGRCRGGLLCSFSVLCGLGVERVGADRQVG